MLTRAACMAWNTFLHPRACRREERWITPFHAKATPCGADATGGSVLNSSTRFMPLCVPACVRVRCLQALEGSLKDIAEGVEKVVKTAEDALSTAEKAAKQATDDLDAAKPGLDTAIAAGQAQGADSAAVSAGQQAESDLKGLTDARDTANTGVTAAEKTATEAKTAAESIAKLKLNKVAKAALFASIQQTGNIINPSADAGLGAAGSTNGNTSVPSQPNGDFTSFSFLKYDDPIQAANCGKQLTHLGYE